MIKPYHTLAKKSIWAVMGLFLLIPFFVFAKTPTDPEYYQQELFYNQINLPSAWDITTGSDNVIVAVIDIGVDINHQDIQDNIWINYAEQKGISGVDDDGNGYVDDFYGWNFIENNNDVSVPDAINIEDKTTVSHGTINAGLIGAAAGNSLDGVGMNWNVKIMAVRAMDNDGSGVFSVVAKAVDYAVKNGADIINLSVVGTSESEIFNKSIKNAYEKGVLVVVAAGNQGSEDKGDLDTYPVYPICSESSDVRNSMLSVTSVDKNNKLSYFANYGSCIDIVAPGQKIVSTWFYEPESGYKSTFGGFVQGTSFSTPLVSGAAALIKSIIPTWGAQELMTNLKGGARNVDLANKTEYEGKLGSGVLDVYKSLQIAIASDAFLVNQFNKIYYYTDNELFSYNILTKKEKLIDRYGNASIRGIVSHDINNNGKEEILILIQRDIYYYIHILNSDTSYKTEFYITNSSKDTNLDSLKLIQEKDGEPLLVSKKIQNNKTSLVQFDLNGITKKEIQIDKNAKWDVGKIDDIYTAYMVGNTTYIKQFGWDNKEKYSWSTKGVDVMLGFKASMVSETDRYDQIILAKQGDRIKEVIVDLPSQSYMFHDVDEYKVGQKWDLMVGPFGSASLPFNYDGGTYDIYKYGYRWIGTVELPKIENLSGYLTAK